MLQVQEDSSTNTTGSYSSSGLEEIDMAGRQAWSNLKFGPFAVTNQVFHLSSSRLSYALVNLKPLLPGHVLVCPTRCVPRLSQMTAEETADLFLVVRKVSRMIERTYQASSLNVAIQDGVDAGQSVPHVHVHIIPRTAHDLDHQGGPDSIYNMMDGEPGNVGKAFLAIQHAREQRQAHREFSAGPDADRKARSEEEMQEEAERLKLEMEKDEQA